MYCVLLSCLTASICLLLLHSVLANLSDEMNCNQTQDVFLCTGKDGRPCIPKANLCNGVPECTEAQDESVQQCGCFPNEFRCRNSCIALVERCDRHVDCPLGEDEENCETVICPVTHFKCNNHFCVPTHAVCDFKDDCGDQSDEYDCPHRPCWHREFRCRNGECIRPGQLCDGRPDCVDGSDERNCTEDHFIDCNDGSPPVNSFFWCDDWANCRFNHADELQCGPCKDTEFMCPNGRCIRRANVCDSQCDCVHVNFTCADETDCDEFYNLQNGISSCNLGVSLGCSVPTAPKGSSTERCIRLEFLCDGFNDCHNGDFLSDEFGCGGSSELSFTCKDNRSLPSSLRCDFKPDCLHGDDEEDCTEVICNGNQFRCANGQCVNAHDRCNLKLDCFDKSDELYCENFTCPQGFKKCEFEGHCLPSEHWCDFFLDCPDNSDEFNCPGNNLTACEKGQFRCDNGQCISGHLQCVKPGDYRLGCADLSHLANCSDWKCSEDQFKCHLGPCLNETLICNSQFDCPGSYWEDEENCSFTCSNSTPQCDCRDIHINCTQRGLTTVPLDVEKEITWFHLGSNSLNETLTNETFLTLDRLLYLNISRNGIRKLPPFVFVNLWRLSVLDLSYNGLTSLSNGSFVGLTRLKGLHLQGNQLNTLNSHAFYGLSSLKTLDLHSQQLSKIAPEAFVGLRNLNVLQLSQNHIKSLDRGALNGLFLLYSLDLQKNSLEVIEASVFKTAPFLFILLTDEFRFCCLAPNIARCEPQPDEFSSCEDLLSNILLRLSVWLLGGIAIVGNVLVIIWRSRYTHGNQVHSFLIANLAMGDLLMGSYLLLIALVDCYYRGEYFIHDLNWRSSRLCAFAGTLSTFSSELSVFTLTVITVDRLLVIIFPFRLRRLEMVRTRYWMALGWLMAGIVSLLPLINIQYFQNFYGRSGVCLALHITTDKPNGWEYSVFVFLILKLLSFSIIAASYLWMFVAARTTHLAVKKDRHSLESAMACRMSLLVATDAACWVPIILLGLASLAGFKLVPKQVFAWVAVFILPLNAAINPVLYTLSTATFISPARNGILSLQRTINAPIRHSSSGNSNRVALASTETSICFTTFRWQQQVNSKPTTGQVTPMNNIKS